jgi:hypothetical protein
MTEKPNLKIPAIVHVHVDNINTNEYERLLSFCSYKGQLNRRMSQLGSLD